MTAQVTNTQAAFVESMTQFFDQNTEGHNEEQLKQAISDALAKTKTNATGRRGRRSTKEPRDPNLPKRPKNAYMLFSDSIREEVKAELIAAAPDGKIRVSDIAKETGERWKSMPETEKQPFVDANAEAKADYEKAMTEYYEKYPDKKVEKATTKKTGGGKKSAKAKKATFSTEAGLPTTPEGFSGAYTGYLKGSVKDPATGKNIQKKFADFNDAVVEAIRLGDACGGITRTSKGYSLRAGTDVKTNSNAGEGIEICWVKGDGSGIEAEVLQEEVVPSSTTTVTTATTEPEPEPEVEASPSDTNSATADFDAETDDDGPPPLEEPEPEPVPEPEPEPVSNDKTEDGDGEEEDDDDDDEDDEDDEDEVNAKEWQWKGVTYYVDDEDDVMTEDGDVIGKRINVGGKYILKKC